MLIVILTEADAQELYLKLTILCFKGKKKTPYVTTNSTPAFGT